MILNTAMTMLMLTSSASLHTNHTKPHPQMVNSTFVIEVVSGLHDVHNFKNFVFFISERLARHTDTSTIFFEDFWDAFPTAPVTIIINNPCRMAGFLSTPSLCLVLTTEKDDPIMELASLSMKEVRYLKTIFILFPIVNTDKFFNSFADYTIFNDNIRELYSWVWKNQFLNTMLITIRNNIYILDPYPTPDIVNKTNNWNIEEFFIDYSQDFKGYEVQTMVRHDLPRVFRVTHNARGRRKGEVSGISGKIFMAFLQAINATFNDTLKYKADLETVDINNIINLVEKQNLEIGVNSYTAMLTSMVGSSYPIGINDWCIMVPFQNRSPEHMYVQRGFNDSSWFLIMFSVFYITVCIWICSPSWERDLSLSFLQSICSIILISPLRILSLPYFRLRYLFILLFVMGFFLTNSYTSKMASYLTTPTAQQQIDTVEDVIEAKLHIMMMDYEYEKLFNMNYPKKFLDLIIVGTKSDLDNHRDRFNSSFGYSTQSDRWFFLNKQQIYLKKPLFRLSTICIGPYYHVFPIQRDSHLDKPLQNFIMTASQVGLMSHWESEAFIDAIYMHYVHMILIDLTPLPLTMTFFRLVWIVWWLGLILAGLAFIFEVKGITWKKVKKVVFKGFAWLKVKISEL
ncbi:ionotropic receptor 56d [Cochliomyia hominivorax]